MNEDEIKSNIDAFIEADDELITNGYDDDDQFYLQKIKLKRELLILNELENKQRLKILEQERELVVQNMKLQDALVLNDSLVNFDQFNTSIGNEHEKEKPYDNQELKNIDQNRLDRITKHFSDVHPPNKDLKRYLSMVTKYQITPEKKFVPIEQYVQNPENQLANNLSSDSKDSESFDLNDSYMNHPSQLIIPNSKSFLHSDSDESVKTGPIENKEIETTDKNMLNLSGSDLEKIANLIEEQENEARKKGITRQSSYYYNGLKLYPNGIIENIIKEHNKSKQEQNETVNIQKMEEKKSNNEYDIISNLKFDENKQDKIEHTFHESDLSTINKEREEEKVNENDDGDSKSHSSYGSIKSDINSQLSLKSDSSSSQKIEGVGNKIYSKIECQPTLTIQHINHVRAIAHNIQNNRPINQYVQVEPMSSARPAIRNNYINTIRDEENGIYTNIEDKMQYKILSKKELVKVDWG